MSAESETNRNLRFSIFSRAHPLAAGSNESVVADGARNVTVCLKKSGRVSKKSPIATNAAAIPIELVGRMIRPPKSERQPFTSGAVSQERRLIRGRGSA
jgi:hypothetical protein